MQQFFCPNCGQFEATEANGSTFCCHQCFTNFEITVLPSRVEQRLFALADIAKNPQLVDELLDMVRKENLSDKGVSL
jgi:hypothetical protein